MRTINALLLGALIYTSFQWFSHYCSLRGVMYYLLTEYDDTFESEKAQNAIKMAVERTLKEFFRIKK
ncbi:MAG: hypothetical protein ACLRSH_06550 [Turicibacter sp.]